MSKIENVTEQELVEKLNSIGQQKQEQFLEQFEQLSKEYGLTFGGQAFVTQDGRIGVNIVLTPRQTQ